MESGHGDTCLQYQRLGDGGRRSSQQVGGQPKLHEILCPNQNITEESTTTGNNKK